MKLLLFLGWMVARRGKDTGMPLSDVAPWIDNGDTLSNIVVYRDFDGRFFNETGAPTAWWYEGRFPHPFVLLPCLY